MWEISLLLALLAISLYYQRAFYRMGMEKGRELAQLAQLAQMPTAPLVDDPAHACPRCGWIWRGPNYAGREKR